MDLMEGKYSQGIIFFTWKITTVAYIWLKNFFSKILMVPGPNVNIGKNPNDIVKKNLKKEKLY